MDKIDNYIFSTAYLPPISYFKHLLNAKNIFIEDSESYQRQSFRNRCCIYSPNGKQTLSIPVKAHNHSHIKDVTIDYSMPWQKHHWRSITTAYNNSAYFIHYKDSFFNFYKQSKHKYLLDFNMELLHFILQTINENTNIEYTSIFQKTYSKAQDFRNSIHPKKKNTIIINPYFQVFEDKHGFKENLSIIDLIFNMGIHSLQII